MAVDGVGTTPTITMQDPRTERPHWLASPAVRHGGERCRRCRILCPPAVLLCIPWPPWSLHVLAPWAELVMDAAPDDGMARLQFADIVEEAGYPEQAAAMRWMGTNGKHPQIYIRRGDLAEWWVTGCTTSDCPNSHHLRGISLEKRLFPTRQEAEDAMIESVAQQTAGGITHAGAIP